MAAELKVSIQPNIGLTGEQRKGAVEILNTLLSDEYVLYTKTRNYHWNVYGMQFGDLHKLFEAQYEALNNIVDEVAERARALGGNALGTLSEFLKKTRLKEDPGKYPDAQTMLGSLVIDHEAIIGSLRGDLEKCANQFRDAGTNNFLTDLMEKHEKMAWMLRSYLQGD